MMSRLITPREQYILLGLGIAIAAGAAVLYCRELRQPAPQPIVYPLADKHVTPGISEPRAEAAPASRPAPLPPPPLPAVPPRPEPACEPPIGVAVMGAVHREGLYFLQAAACVDDLIEAAGGLTEEADISGIALTAGLIDGTTLTVPKIAVLERKEDTLRLRRGRAAVYNPPSYTRSGARIASGTKPITTQGTRAKEPRSGPEAVGLLNLNAASAAELETLPGIGPVLAGRIVAEREQAPFVSVEELIRVSGIGEKKLEALRTLVTAP